MKYYITALCGSRAYGLELENSDLDRMSFVFDDGTLDFPDDTSLHIKDELGDHFLNRLESLYQIGWCASPYVAPHIDNVLEHSSKVLSDYWTENGSGLADISARITYESSIMQVEWYLDNNYEVAYKNSAKLLGLMWGRYYLGDMLSAKNFSEVWKERFYAAKAGSVSKSNVESWLQELKTRSIQDYFSIQPVNYALHDQYKLVIDQVLKETAESTAQ